MSVSTDISKYMGNAVKLAEIWGDIIVNVKAFGAKGDGVTDDTAAIAAAIASIGPTGGTLFLPAPNRFKANITITEKSKITITGGGTLLGTIYMRGKDTTGVSRFTGSTQVTIDGIAIDGEKTRKGISIRWYFGCTIRNTRFVNCTQSVYFESIDASQHSSRWAINNNHFIDSNYGLYVDHPIGATNKFGVGDIHFCNNLYESQNSASNGGTFGNVYHVWCRGMDGILIEGNTFFFANTGMEKSNIYIEIFNWTIIQGNNLFEAKEHAIRCKDGQNVTISGNNIAWTNKEAIYLSDNVVSCNVVGNNMTWKDESTPTTNRTGVLIEGCPFLIGSVSSNTFQFPNEHAIKVSSATRISIIGNNGLSKYSTLEAIKIDYSNVSLGVVTGNIFSGFGILLKKVIKDRPTTSTVIFSGNSDSDQGSIHQGVFSPSFRSYTGTETTIDFSNSSLIVLSQSAPTTITALTSETLANTPVRFITLYSYNNNTTISNTVPSIVLGGSGESVTIPARGSITFMIYSGEIREVQRSFTFAYSGSTANRPTTALYTGRTYYDTTLGKPIWWNGSGWRDAIGTAV